MFDGDVYFKLIIFIDYNLKLKVRKKDLPLMIIYVKKIAVNFIAYILSSKFGFELLGRSFIFKRKDDFENPVFHWDQFFSGAYDLIY